jgi:cardiolipin synthase
MRVMQRLGDAYRRRLRLGLACAAILAIGCARVPEHYVLPELEVEKSEFAATLAAYTGTGVVGGNRIEILLNGDEIFPATLAVVRAARRNINFAQYFYQDGPPAEDLAEAFAERCRAGVEVNILLDAVGALRMPGELKDLMKDAGCRVELFRPLSPFALQRTNFRNHRRILVVDGLVGKTGGSGISEDWSGDGRQKGHWRDTDVVVEGPVVAQLQGAFAENWLETTGVALGGPEYFPKAVRKQRGSVDAQVVRSAPKNGSHAIYTMFLLAIASAQRSISITNPYFLPDERMLEVLTEAAERGVRVTLLVPAAIDNQLVRQASRSDYGRLLLSGVRIYEYGPAYLHAKTMTIDGTWSTVGSSNLDHRSMGLSDEINLVIYDAGIARKLEQIFEQDLRHAKRISYEAWENRTLVSRFFELLSIPLREQM